jgi:hypothetical protein
MNRVTGQEIRCRLRTDAGGHRLTDEVYNERTVARITARVVVHSTGCWLWKGFVHKTGYGMTSYRGQNSRVHRVMWLAAKGPIPPKMDVCHRCDVRHCCNPDHLWLGTRSQNLQDMVDKGRGPCGAKAARTHCHRGHPLSGDNIYTYDNHRRCKACDLLRQKSESYRKWSREYQRRKRAAKRVALREQRA